MTLKTIERHQIADNMICARHLRQTSAIDSNVTMAYIHVTSIRDSY